MKKLFIAFLALAAVVSCQRKDMLSNVKAPGEVRFTAAVGDYSFTKATDSALENGDKVRIVAGTPINATAVGTVEGTALTLDTPIYWGAEQTESTTFAGIYQSGEVASATASLEYDLLYGGAHAYESHNLFMAAAKTVAPGTTVALNFKHPFSKININITNQLDNDAVAKVQVKDVVMDAALDIANETVTLGTTKKSFEAFKLADNKYAAIIMPQKAAPSIVVTTASGKAYTFALADAFTFAPGSAYTAALTLKPGATPPPPGEAVAFTFAVTPWADGGALEYGDGVEYTPSWAVCGKLNGAEDWVDDAIVMTQTTPGTEAWEGIWEADIDYKGGDVFKLRWGRDWARQAGMNTEWAFYAIGEFDAESYLWGENGVDILLGTALDETDPEHPVVVYPEDGSYHLKFIHEGYKLVVTKNAD